MNEAASEGVKIVYPSGRKYNLESVVRTAVMTGVNQATSKITVANAERMGSDLVLTTAHLGARTGEGYKGHVNWQGKVYSVSGQQHPEEEKRIGYRILNLSDATGYGKVDGLCGANCRHSILVWTEGYSENHFRDYDREENRKRYEAQQEQRRRERNIRDTKRKLLALKEARDSWQDENTAGRLQEDYDRQARRLKQQQQEYKKFCEDNGLQTENERMQIAKYSRREAAEAYQRGRTESINSALIKKIQAPFKELKAKGITDKQLDDIQSGIDEISAEYDIKLDKVRISGAELPQSVPMLYRVNQDNIRELLINPHSNMWSETEQFWASVEATHFTAARNVKEAVWHEMAHAITFSGCSTAEECFTLEKILQDKYVPGISRYNDISRDGSETIAEAFVKKRRGMKIPDEAKKLLEKYVEDRRK